MKSNNFRFKITGWSFFIGAVILAGCAIRIFAAWFRQYNTNSDVGVVALMAKHMAEGIDFPVFFYGQPYMGSLEPAVSALCCKLFGFSPFMIYMGTAIVGMFFLPLIYLWARDAGGRRAGLVALILCMVGSSTFFTHSVDPRGGYMAMMTLGTLVIYLAARIALLSRNNQPISIYYYLGLGFAAGLGWWSNQLVVVFLFTACVILLTGFSWRMLRTGFTPSLLAFFTGSAPWWIWNARHNWATFDFGSSIGTVPLTKGVTAFILSTVDCIELSNFHSRWNNACLFALASTMILFLVLLVRDKIRREKSQLFFLRLAAPVLILALAMASVTSRYILFQENSRYLLPAIPALSVMAGVSIDWLLQKMRLPVAWLLLLFLIPKNSYMLMHVPDGMAYRREQWQNATRLAESLVPQCDGICIGDYCMVNWITFATAEKLCVASMPWEKYAPYAKSAELSGRTAVLDNHFKFRSFLEYTAAKSKRVSFGNIEADYELTPPSDQWRYISCSSIIKVYDDTSQSNPATLTNLHNDTRWSTTLKPGETNSLTFEFNTPKQVCGIRFITPDGHPPGTFSIEGKTTSSDSWKSLLPPTKSTGYFWSGPYVKLEGLQMFEEARFASLTAGVVSLRLTMLNKSSEPRVILLSKVLLMEQAPAPADKLPSAKECLALLRLKGVQQFFGPRWLVDHLACEPGGKIAMNIPSSISRSVDDTITTDSETAPVIPFSETTGLLLDERDAEHSRDILKEAGKNWEEYALGCCRIIIVPKNATDDNDWLNHPAIYWTEQGCFFQESSLQAKAKAEFLFRQGIDRKNTRDFTGLIKNLERALIFYPQHQPARRLLADVLEQDGKHDKAAIQRAEVARQTTPKYKADIKFPGGIELLGISLLTDTVIPGGHFEMAYHWKCPPTVDVDKFAVFVHFKGAKGLFQDDHSLLNDVSKTNLMYQPFQEVFTYTRSIAVPESAPDGKYTITIGLLNEISKQRLHPVTTLKQKHHSIELPVTLLINKRSQVHPRDR